jgi:hypothetical protein
VGSTGGAVADGRSLPAFRIVSPLPHEAASAPAATTTISVVRRRVGRAVVRVIVRVIP